MDFGSFSQDTKTIFASVRALEIIGEATRNIPGPVRRRYRAVPWRNMGDMRNRLIHDYRRVNLAVVWRVLTEELEPLKPQIARIIEELTAEESASGP